MKHLLEHVNQRTHIAGQNRLELLLFYLHSEQLYGINVFKVREVIQFRSLNSIPKAHDSILGLLPIRSKTIPVIDLNQALGFGVTPESAFAQSFIIITEYNQSIQGFLVRKLNRITNLKWSDVSSPPHGVDTEEGGYITAMSSIEEGIVEILDVERVLHEVIPPKQQAKVDIHTVNLAKQTEAGRVLLVDDSHVARKQIREPLVQAGFDVVECLNGEEAIEYLKTIEASSSSAHAHLSVIISDIEMPRIDGYTLCKYIKESEKLKEIYTILHTSLSGAFNTSLVQKVQADDFVSKFNTEALMQSIVKAVEKGNSKATKKNP